MCQNVLYYDFEWDSLSIYKAYWKSFENDKNTFFHLKSSFLKDISIFVINIWPFDKRLDKKAKINFKIYDVTNWITSSYSTDTVKYLKKQVQSYGSWFSWALGPYFKTKIK